MQIRRSKLLYGVAIIIVIIVGLATRSNLAIFLPDFIARYAGDTLWALVLFLVVGFVLPSLSTLQVTLIALIVSFSVEFSQLNQADVLISIRSNRIGALFLGKGFVWSDLVCYTVGILIGILLELGKLQIANKRAEQDAALDG